MQVDVRLDDVVLRALESEPSRRYQQAGEVKTAVDAISRHSTNRAKSDETPHASASVPIPKWLSQHARQLPLIGIGVLVIVAILTVGLLRGLRPLTRDAIRGPSSSLTSSQSHDAGRETTVVDSPDIRATEWALANTFVASVAIDGTDREIELRSGDQLPQQPFRLVGISVSGSAESLTDLTPLRDCKSLRSFRSIDTSITDEALADIDNAQGLEVAQLDGTLVTNEGLRILAKHKTLRDVSLHRTRVTGSGLAHLHGMNSLRTLVLPSEIDLDSPEVKSLQAALPGCQIRSDQGSVQRPSPPSSNASTSPSNDGRAAAIWLLERGGLLRVEAAGKTTWTDSLPALPAGPIRILDLEGSRCPALTDEALIQLAPGLKDLETLKGNNMVFTGTGFAAWQEQRRLHTFASVGGGRGSVLTDQGLEHLSRIASLKHLNCNSDRITDAGLAHLSKMPNLIEIELSRAPITDAGLEHLNKMNQLLTLRLRDTRVTSSGIHKLRTALPKCNISY